MSALIPAERREIPQCDHQFCGAVNGRVLSQAPLWAFAKQACEYPKLAERFLARVDG